jgi:hypothetical protein
VVLSSIPRAILATSGRPVLQRALALWTAVGLVATVLFGGQGLDARRVTSMFHAGTGMRLALAVGWTLLATPVVSSAFDAPGTRTLRTLPVSRSAWVGWLLVLVLAVQAPCCVLFARGDGPGTALAEMLLAAAMQSSLVAATRRPRFVGVAATALAIVLLDASPLFTLAPAAALACAGVGAAWRVILDASGRDLHMTRVTWPVLALASAYVLRIVRAARARLALAVGTVSLGALALSLSLLNDPSSRPIARMLAVLALPLTLCAAVLVGPVRDTEERMRAVVRVTRTHWTTLLGAFALAIGLPSSALAATASAVAGAAAHAPALPLGGAAGAWAVPIACAMAAWARVHDRKTRRSPVLFVVGVIGVGAIFTGVGVAW